MIDKPYVGIDPLLFVVLIHSVHNIVHSKATLLPIHQSKTFKPSCQPVFTTVQILFTLDLNFLPHTIGKCARM